MNEKLTFELGFCPTDNGTKNNGAMYLQYQNLVYPKSLYPKVIVFNGGSEDCSRKVIKHVRNGFKTNKIDLLISTTPDINHGFGLLEIITNLNVGEIWMHRPWLYMEDFPALVKNRVTPNNGLQYKWKTGLPVFMEIETIATQKGIEIKEPFTGLSFDNSTISVLGPSEDYYKSLLNSWRNTKEESITASIKKLLSFKKRNKAAENNPENNLDVSCLFSSSRDKFILTEGQLSTF